MSFILNTPRLLLRPFQLDDAEALFHLNADPEVLQYTGDLPFESILAARAFISAYDAYERYGMGRWAVLSAPDQQFLGWCGLKYTAHLDEYDLGFRFFQAFWNQGYATEASKACLQWAFETRKLKEVVGRAMLVNKASIHVLEKLGMCWQRPYSMDEQPAGIWSIKYSTWSMR